MHIRVSERISAGGYLIFLSGRDFSLHLSHNPVTCPFNRRCYCITRMNSTYRTGATADACTAFCSDWTYSSSFPVTYCTSAGTVRVERNYRCLPMWEWECFASSALVLSHFQIHQHFCMFRSECLSFVEEIKVTKLETNWKPRLHFKGTLWSFWPLVALTSSVRMDGCSYCVSM